MMMMFGLWLVIIGFEIVRNYWMIDLDHERPVYWQSTVLRIAVGFVFWLLSPFMDHTMSYGQWWGMIPMMVLSFWFCFDYGLNLARGKKPFYYLNPEGSLLDKFQCNYPNTYVWFWWKLILMLAGLMVRYYGVDNLWNG